MLTNGSADVIKDEFMKFVNTFYENLDILNQDDVSIYQKIFSTLSKNWKKNLNDIILNKGENNFQDLIVKIMDNIINKNTNLIPITKHLAEVFYETVKVLDTFSDETLEKVILVLKMAYSKNKQNLD